MNKKINFEEWTEGEKNTFALGINYALIQMIQCELDVMRTAKLKYPDGKEARAIMHIMYNTFELKLKELNDYVAQIQGYKDHDEFMKAHLMEPTLNED